MSDKSKARAKDKVVVLPARFMIAGTAALKQHNERLADPLNEHSRALSALTANKKKTEDDHWEIAKTEFVGGLYWDEEHGPYIPGRWLYSGLIEAAKREKLGTAIEQFCRVVEDVIPLQYEGPRDPEGLWEANYWCRDGVVVGGKRVIRTRPIFRQWRVDFHVLINGMEYAPVLRAMERLGEFVGIGDNRPVFGRFAVEAAHNGR